MATGLVAQPIANSISKADDTRPWRLAFTVAVCALAALLLLRPLFIPVLRGDHYLYLAEHLTRGELWVDDIPSDYSDVVSWQGHKYLPFGPLPSVLLVPFLPLMQLLGSRDLAWIGYLFTLLNAYLFWQALGRAGVSDQSRKWTSLLFFGGTVYYAASVVAATWYFAHVLTTTFLLLAIWEVLGKRRPALIGVYLGLAGLVRFTALFALPFFVWMLWRGKDRSGATYPQGTDSGNAERRLHPVAPLWHYALLLAGMLGPILLQLLYNYARFANPLESGYAYATLTNSVLGEALRHGLFSLVHLPKNLFMMLLQGPVPYPSENAPVLEFPYMQPSQWGMGIFFTSPALLYIFRARLKEPLVQACWVGVVCVMLPIITYYGVGWTQFGFRYALDFTPFLALLAARGFSAPMSSLSRALILASVAVNLWGALFLAKWV